MTVAVNRAPFADPRPLTKCEALRQAEFKAHAAMLRMRAALMDLECARIEELAGEDAESSGRGQALLIYRQERQHYLDAARDASRLRREVGAATVDAFAPYAPRPAAGELREVAP